MGNLEGLTLDLEQSADSSEASKLSQSQEKHFALVTVLLAEVKSSYPNQEVTAQTETVWGGYWSEMLDEYGEGTFREALYRHCRSARFLPAPSDLDELCRAIRNERADLKESLWRKCGKCSNGWQVKQGPSGSFAVRCDCYEQWKRDIKAVGI